MPFSGSSPSYHSKKRQGFLLSLKFLQPQNLGGGGGGGLRAARRGGQSFGWGGAGWTQIRKRWGGLRSTSGGVGSTSKQLGGLQGATGGCWGLRGAVNVVPTCVRGEPECSLVRCILPATRFDGTWESSSSVHTVKCCTSPPSAQEALRCASDAGCLTICRTTPWICQ